MSAHPSSAELRERSGAGRSSVGCCNFRLSSGAFSIIAVDCNDRGLAEHPFGQTFTTRIATGRYRYDEAPFWSKALRRLEMHQSGRGQEKKMRQTGLSAGSFPRISRTNARIMWPHTALAGVNAAPN
jgi:hypothetical protein